MKGPSKSKSVFWSRNSFILLRFQIESFWPEFAYFQRWSTFWKKKTSHKLAISTTAGFEFRLSKLCANCQPLLTGVFDALHEDWIFRSVYGLELDFLPYLPILQERWLFWWLRARFPRGRVCPRWQMGREWPNTCYQRRANGEMMQSGFPGFSKKISARRYVFTSTGTRKQHWIFPNRARFVDMCGKTLLFPWGFLFPRK